jgi:prolyl oligopeptidase
MKTLVFSILLIQCAVAQIIYPKAKEIPTAEFRFGEVISDEFKWMENPTDPDLWDWIKEEQDLTLSQLNPTTFSYFYNRLIEIAEHKKSLESKPEVKQSTARLAQHNLPFLLRDVENQKTTFTVPESLYEYKSETVYGGDLQRIIITKKDDKTLADIILVKFFGFIKWDSEKSFIYSTGTDGILGDSRAKILKHIIGENQADDEVLLTSSHPKVSIWLMTSNGSSFVIEQDSRDSTTKISLFDLTTKKKSFETSLTSDVQSIESLNQVIGVSFENSNNGELISTDLETGIIKVLIPEQDFVMSNIIALDEGLKILKGSKDAEAKVFLIDSTFKLTEIKFPNTGDISFQSFSSNTNLVEFSFKSYSTPPAKYTYDLATQKLSFESIQSYPTEVEEVKVHYTATNGQKTAMTVIKSKGTKLTKTTPMIIYGYGGFNYTMLPSFNPIGSLPWLEKGGAIAIVTLPGSLAYGKSWNTFAKVGGRINSWDSFANAGKKLIELSYTSSEHLGMAGGSNGGLLVAGTLQRHPNLFKAATPMVGVLDMLNFNLFTAGKYWEWEYGNPFKEEIFYQLIDISPYHNLEKIDYPAVMVMTAEFDDRVVPSHSYKYTARLQQLTTGNAPILLYNKEWGGHSSRSGSKKQKYSYSAAMFTFFANQLGL